MLLPMPFINDAMKQEAIELLKQGYSAAEVFDRLIARGAGRTEAQVFVQQLLDLKRVAEESAPARMLADASSLFQQGATAAQVVQYFQSRGIDEANIARLFETLRASVPCQRCRALVQRNATYYDRHGNQVCGACNDSDEISAGDRRVVERELRDQGVSAYALQKNNALVWCPRCQDHTGVLHSATHYVGGLLPSSDRSFVCSRCSQPVG